MAELHLALLLSGPRHGYDIKHAHDSWFPQERPLPFGQVYSTLARLVRDGLAEVVETRTEGGPERTVYAVTDAGRQRLLDWLDAPAPPAGTGGEEIVRKTVVALHSAAAGADAAHVLTAQRTAHLRRMRELLRTEPSDSSDPSGRTARAQRPDDGLAAHLARRHALLHLDADLRWLEEAVDALRTASPPAPRTLSPTAAPASPSPVPSGTDSAPAASPTPTPTPPSPPPSKENAR